MPGERRYGPGEGPAPRPLDDAEIDRLLAEQPFGVLGTHRKDGTTLLTIVVQAWDPCERTLRISTTEDRLKVRHLRRDPRAEVIVTSGDHLSSVRVEGAVEVGAVSAVPGDATGLELLRLQHEPVRSRDTEAFLERMVLDRRLVLRLRDPRLRGSTLAD